jgi:ribosomal protein S18 acetylase RimI-like enzyme
MSQAAGSRFPASGARAAARARSDRRGRVLGHHRVVVDLRRVQTRDVPAIWALNTIPNIGATADPDAPLGLPVPATAPGAFPDLADPLRSFVAVGGDFIVGELDGHIVAMGGFRPDEDGRAEVLRVRVHPALRRRGIGTALMNELERRAIALGFTELRLDTASNQPEAVAFYHALGFRQIARETRSEWSWTLLYFTKSLVTSQ